MRYAWLLLLTGCATQSIDELNQQLASCLPTGQDCSEIQAKIDTRLEIERKKRVFELATECPNGAVFYSTGEYKTIYGVRVPDGSCIPASALRDLF